MLLMNGSCDIPDNAISSLAKFLRDRVSLVNDKVLVEDLEHLSTREICHLAWMSRFGNAIVSEQIRPCKSKNSGKWEYLQNSASMTSDCCINRLSVAARK